MPSDPSTVFISYNGADRKWAEWMAWILEEAGFSVVVQAWDVRPGHNFVLAMQGAAAHFENATCCGALLHGWPPYADVCELVLTDISLLPEQFPLVVRRFSNSDLTNPANIVPRT